MSDAQGDFSIRRPSSRDRRASPVLLYSAFLNGYLDLEVEGFSTPTATGAATGDPSGARRHGLQPNSPCAGAAIAISSGAGSFPTYGVNFSVQDPFSSATGGDSFGNKGEINGEVIYLGVQTGGPLFVRIFNNSDCAGSPLHTIRIPEFGPLASGPQVKKFQKNGLDFGAYCVDAFRDPSDTGRFNATTHPYILLGSEVLSSTRTHANVEGTGGFGVMTDLGQGGSINQFSGSFLVSSGTRFDGGATDLGFFIALDTTSAGPEGL